MFFVSGWYISTNNLAKSLPPSSPIITLSGLKKSSSAEFCLRNSGLYAIS